MDYRRLKQEDAGAYWRLRLEAVEREPRSFGTTPEEHRRKTLDEIAEMILKDGTFVMGAFDDEAFVGFARFVQEPGKKERHKGHVYGVYVTASHRGRGVAKAMIGALVAEVKKGASCEQLLLAVGVFNEGARAVYRALGFLPYGVEPRALKADGVYLDEEQMILLL